MASTDETIRQALAANLHLASPAAMAQILTRGVYERPPHVDLINKYLAETVFGDLRRLLIALPPGHGKSKLCLVWYIIWRLAIRPQDRIGLITHTFELAREWGLEIRTIMNEFFPELGIEINEDSKAAHRWSTAEGGGLVCAGVGTALIGRRLNCVQVDDPVPDAEAAESPTQQEKVWKYLQWVINSRLEPGASVTMIHQRWSINDPIAKAVKAHELGPDSEGYDDWNLISIPALAEQNDILGRTEGSALWPQRFNEEALYRIRRAMGDYAFAAMFQQRPSPMGGGLIKEAWWNYWFPRGTAGDWPDVKVSGRTAVFAELPEHFDAIIQSWDMNFRDSVRAIQGGQEPDAVAGHVWGRKGADYFLLDRFWGKVGLNETIHAVREMTLNNPGAEAKLVEQAANGPAVMAKLRHEISGFIEVTPRGKKVARAMMMEAAPNSADRDARALTMAGAIQGGNFYLPHPGYRPWSEQFRHLVGQFPKDGKDDTDAMSQAWAFLARGQYKDLKRAHSEALQYREAPRSTQMIFNQKVRGMTEKAMQGDKHRNYWS